MEEKRIRKIKMILVNHHRMDQNQKRESSMMGHQTIPRSVYRKAKAKTKAVTGTELSHQRVGMVLKILKSTWNTSLNRLARMDR